MKTLPIPQHWKPRQALAYFEFLAQLQQAIWDTYDDQIVPIIIAENVPEPPDDNDDKLDPDDDIPF